MVADVVGSLASSAIGRRPFSSVWQWLGGLAALLFFGGVATHSPSLDVLARVGAFFALPDGFAVGVGGVQEWLVAHAVAVETAAATIIFVALLSLAYGTYSRDVMPSGPAAASIFVALLLWQSSGFNRLYGDLVGMAILVVIFGAMIRSTSGWNGLSFRERAAVVFVELGVQAISVPFLVATAAVWPARRARSGSPEPTAS